MPERSSSCRRRSARGIQRPRHNQHRT